VSLDLTGVGNRINHTSEGICYLDVLDKEINIRHFYVTGVYTKSVQLTFEAYSFIDDSDIAFSEGHFFGLIRMDVQTYPTFDPSLTGYSINSSYDPPNAMISEITITENGIALFYIQGIKYEFDLNNADFL
jgi:hypothetical protein